MERSELFVMGRFVGTPESLCGKDADAYPAPENGWLEYFFVSFWGKRPFFQGRTVCFRECT